MRSLQATRGRACTRTRSGISLRHGSTAAGLSAREIADYLGHERVSMTQDVYMTRKATGANASAAFDAFGPESAG